jgi:hypothetical protein
MKKLLKNIGILSLVLVIGLSGMSFADDYGAAGAETKTEFSIEEMLNYGLEDEYLAKAEYELIIDHFDVSRPFTNILKAEENHIVALERLYEAYAIELPTVDPEEHTLLPASVDVAFETGVTAEIKNIEMYESFLEQDLPEDIRFTFEALKNASENHLEAFERNSEPRTNTFGGNSRGNKGQRGFNR